MVYIIHDGRPRSALCFVTAHDDFGAWFDETYRPWAKGAEEHPVAIVGVVPKVEWRGDPLGFGFNVRQPRGFATMSGNEFLRSDAVVQKRDGEPRPRYRSERFRITTKRVRARADSETTKSVKVLAKIAGAGATCVPRSIGGRVLFERSQKLRGLLGSADCDENQVSLLLHNLTIGEAASALLTLVLMRRGKKR
jgi:hypothetical protein